MRRAYHKWGQEMGGQVPPPWEDFVQAVLNNIWEAEEKEDAVMEAEVEEEAWEEEDEEEEKPEGFHDPYPGMPIYKPGMLKEEWWEENLNWKKFRRCKECGQYKYIHQKNEMRHGWARGCMTEGCPGARKNGSHYLLKMLAKVYGEEVLEGYLQK